MNDEKLNDDLSVFFDAAKQSRARPSDELMARILGDALEIQAQAAAPEATRQAKVPGFFTGFRVALGGWPALAGLVVIAFLGLWLGYTPALGVGDAMTASLGLSGNGFELVNSVMGEETGFEFAFDEGDAG